MRHRFGPFLCLTALGWASGCGEPRLLNDFSEGLTRLRLEPREFVGSVPCQRDTPGALQAYVVLLQGISAPGGADAGLTTLYTAGPVPCDQAVLFPAVAGRFYAAEIHGFDRPVLPADLQSPAGRWTATCGRGSADDVPDGGLDPYRSTFAQRGVTVPIRGCTSFASGPAGNSQLIVDQPSALGARTCGFSTGQVSGFRATLEGVTREAACGDPLVFDVSGPDRHHVIELTAFELGADAGSVDAGAFDAGTPVDPNAPVDPLDGGADAGDPLDASVVEPSQPPGDPTDAGGDPGPSPLLGTPRWSTRCVGRSLPGVAARAFCDPLTPLP